MNSTFKSLLFWLVLVVIGALIWQFSANFQRTSDEITFIEFIEQGEQAARSRRSRSSGNEITGNATRDPSGQGVPHVLRRRRRTRASPTT